MIISEKSWHFRLIQWRAPRWAYQVMFLCRPVNSCEYLTKLFFSILAAIFALCLIGLIALGFIVTPILAVANWIFYFGLNKVLSSFGFTLIATYGILLVSLFVSEIYRKRRDRPYTAVVAVEGVTSLLKTKYISKICVPVNVQGAKTYESFF